jgi:3-hydroxyisobutyrate dehydrogenase
MSSIGNKSYEPAAPQRVAFLGLGVMGHPMAGHLARAGHAVTVYNRTPAKAAAWVEEFGGAMASTPAIAAADAGLVFACVGNDDDLRSVTLGPDGALAAMAPGSIFVDHTTASAEVARHLARQAQSTGLHFVDAPVSGGQAGAVHGVLTVMCGGDDHAFQAMRSVAMALSLIHI